MLFVRVGPPNTPSERQPLLAQCPACGLHELVPVHLETAPEGLWRPVMQRAGDHPEGERVEIDACPVCYGAWFDRGELDLLSADQGRIEDHLTQVGAPGDRQCPRGHGAMTQHRMREHLSTVLDRCSTCGGLWLDGEERRKLAKATTKEGQETVRERWIKRGAIWVAQVLTQMPVEVENPVRSTPWVVFGILLTLLSVFCLELGGFVDAYTYGIVAGRMIREGTVENLFFYQWLHGSWIHLLGNAYFLYTFGDNIEHMFGRLRFLAFYVLAGMAGGVAHVLLTEATALPVVGASGAVAGVLAAYLWTFPRARLLHVFFYVQLKLPVWAYLAFWVVFHLFMGLFTHDRQVAWFAHLGGFLFGLAATPLLLHLRRRQIARTVQIRAVYIRIELEGS